MSKWEESFKKSDKSCLCKDSLGLFIPRRQLSALIVGILSVSFCIFMGGYFLGKKTLAQQFIETAQKEHQEDTIILSNFANNMTTAHSGQSNLLLAAAENKDVDILGEKNKTITPQNSEIVKNEDTRIESISSEQYYAQLIGFGTEKAAQQFTAKISNKGVPAEIKKRMSKTAKGRISYWYQVVTTPYHDKNSLLMLVDKLSKEEKLKGVSIRSC